MLEGLGIEDRVVAVTLFLECFLARLILSDFLTLQVKGIGGILDFLSFGLFELSAIAFGLIS